MKTIISYLFLLGWGVSLSAQNADCLPCLIYNSFDDAQVQATIKHFQLEKKTETKDGYTFITFHKKGIKIIGEDSPDGMDIFAIEIFPQFFEGDLPYGLSKNLTLAETKAAFEKAMGGATYSTGMPTTSIGQNSVKVNDLSQKADTRAFFNPDDTRIVKILIDPSSIGPPEDFSYQKCFQKAKSSPFPKYKGASSDEEVSNWTKIFDDAFNHFENVKGEFFKNFGKKESYRLDFKVKRHENIYIDVHTDVKVGRYQQPRVLLRSIEGFEYSKLALEVTMETLEKEINALYPSRTLKREEYSHGKKGKRIEISMPFTYDGEELALKSYGSYFTAFIVYDVSEDDDSVYNLFLYLERVEL